MISLVKLPLHVHVAAVCKREPLYYGGRGIACKPCEGAGDAGTTIGLAAGGLACALLAVVLGVTIFKRRVTNWIGQMVNVAASVNKKDGRDAFGDAAKGELTRSVSKRSGRMARLLTLISELGVKARIL
eukprot:4656264-Prymnesium_polylepis.1